MTTERSRPRVLMVQPSINPPGGGNAVACWMLQALRADYAVTLLTREAPDLERANRVFGTSITADDVRVVIAPLSSGAHLALLRDHLLLARARRMTPDYDVVITAHNESDLGPRGIQYVHFPKLLAERPDPGLRWYQGPRAVAAYQAVCAIVTGFRSARMRRNITLVNSDWTGRLMRARHGVEPITLHPPAAGPFPDVPWHDRRQAFVCVGRIAPEKRLEAVIGIVARVRRTSPEVTLHIAGNADDRTYLARVQAAVDARRDWVTLDLDLPREQLLRLMASCRYGIHGMRDEHFGMAVAELVCAGTIPFAHRSGGPAEILGGDEQLLYNDEDDAVARIRQALSDEAQICVLRETLAQRAAQFSSDAFVHTFRQVVATIVAERAGVQRGA